MVRENLYVQTLQTVIDSNEVYKNTLAWKQQRGLHVVKVPPPLDDKVQGILVLPNFHGFIVLEIRNNVLEDH